MLKSVIWLVISFRNSLVSLVICVLSWICVVRIKHKAGFYLIGEDGQNIKAWPFNSVFQVIIGNTIGRRADGLD